VRAQRSGVSIAEGWSLPGRSGTFLPPRRAGNLSAAATGQVFNLAQLNCHTPLIKPEASSFPPIPGTWGFIFPLPLAGVYHIHFCIAWFLIAQKAAD